jgi:hypothetical protein
VYGAPSSIGAPIRLCGRRVDLRVLALSLAAVVLAVLLVVLLAGGDEDDGALVVPDAPAAALPAPSASANSPAPPGSSPAPPGNSPTPPAGTCRDDPSWVDSDGDGCSTCKLLTALARRCCTLSANLGCNVRCRRQARLVLPGGVTWLQFGVCRRRGRLGPSLLRQLRRVWCPAPAGRAAG